MSSEENRKKIACFDNSYVRLPERFYQRVEPFKVKNPSLIRFNHALARELNISVDGLSDDEIAGLFSGRDLPDGAEPAAQAYAGHQFGHFVPQLGDGRAVLLGEVIDQNGGRRDIQLKGSGQTRFSRRGDGLAAVGPVMREYILSEAMHRLGVPTTRSLAMVATGEPVYREAALPGAVLTRVAASHIRVGTFEYFASRGDEEGVRELADYVIARHYPGAAQAENPYIAILKSVVERQASLIARWLHMGFIHGVMNTDNTAVSGETIDYGPCAFMDEYNPATVFSSIDQHGRYAYGNQGKIAHWNLTRLAEGLLPLFDKDEKRAVTKAEQILDTFQESFSGAWVEGMCAKIGITRKETEDITLIQDFLILMNNNDADYTLSFRYLCEAAEEADARKLKTLFVNAQPDKWLERWRERLKKEERSPAEAAESMRAVNPAFIPRNHRVEQAIQAAVNDADYSKADRLIKVLERPFEDQPENREYMDPPRPDERVLQTFCGT